MEGGGGDSSDQLCARAHLLGVEGGHLEGDEEGGLDYSGKLFFFPSLFFLPAGWARGNTMLIGI